MQHGHISIFLSFKYVLELKKIPRCDLFQTPQKRKRGAETGGGQSRKRSALASSSRSAIGNSGKKAPASKSKGTAKKSTALKSGKANNDAAEEDDGLCAQNLPHWNWQFW